MPCVNEARGYLTERRLNWGLIGLIVGLHALAIYGLVRAFAPDLAAAALNEVTSLVTVNVTPPNPPVPTPSPDPKPEPDEGAAGEAGKKAVARAVVAPVPAVPIPRPSPAPQASSTGTANTSGASDAGEGTGAGGAGDGTGSGRGGNGRGGIAVSAPEKIAGDINDARDYPVPPGGRQVRRGQSVVIYMTVMPDGRASNCRVVEPSPDPEADAITCRLALERFRFNPARDANGDPVAAPYGWRQRWF